MEEKMKELRAIIIKFAESGWDLIDEAAKRYLSGEENKAEFVATIEQADQECGSCGCEFDSMYKKFFAMKELL